MDEGCLHHLLTDEERSSFESEGYLIIKNALPEDFTCRLEATLKKVEAKRQRIIKAQDRKRNCLQTADNSESRRLVRQQPILLAKKATFCLQWWCLPAYVHPIHQPRTVYRREFWMLETILVWEVWQ